MKRRGLAPLELVLALPLLLFVMALMVGMGTAGAWKVRALSAARQRVWADRWPRTAELSPRPASWPWPATWETQEDPPLAELDLDVLNQPVVRGPLGSIQVDERRLDPTLRVIKGHAWIARRPPLLPELGVYEFDLEHPLLDGKWQFRQMELLTNRSRRLPVLYTLPKAAQEAAYRAAVQELSSSPGWRDWWVLDRDDEFIRFYGSAPDFHPGLAGFCSLDMDEVRRSQVNPLLDRIKGAPPPPRPRPGVPRNMASRFLSMYQDELNRLLAPDAPPNPARIAELRTKIAQLEAFLRRL